MDERTLPGDELDVLGGLDGLDGLDGFDSQEIEARVEEAVPLGDGVDGDAAAADVGGDADGLLDIVTRYTYDGDRGIGGHESGEARERGFVRGGDDPRDALIAERIEAEDVAWRGRIFDVDTLQVELADGRPARRDVVRHPGAVAIVALTDDGRICLVRQYRTALDRVTVEIPAGKLDPGEDPLACAQRELAEETGLVAGRMAFLTTIATSVGFADELIHIYMATDLAAGPSSPDDDEFINVDLVPLQELIDAVLDGQVEDAKTVVGALVCDAVSHRLG